MHSSYAIINAKHFVTIERDMLEKKLYTLVVKIEFVEGLNNIIYLNIV